MLLRCRALLLLLRWLLVLLLLLLLELLGLLLHPSLGSRLLLLLLEGGRCGSSSLRLLLACREGSQGGAAVVGGCRQDGSGARLRSVTRRCGGGRALLRYGCLLRYRYAARSCSTKRCPLLLLLLRWRPHRLAGRWCDRCRGRPILRGRRGTPRCTGGALLSHRLLCGRRWSLLLRWLLLRWRRSLLKLLLLLGRRRPYLLLLLLRLLRHHRALRGRSSRLLLLHRGRPLHH